eukprot:gnl/Spiro4/27917_TR13823_c0_g1_i1.p1 gnl/Spiro4/27917_TR13823_c0_g1~~gnl/Spiro4/27917_TR13823_c0_g1_i1.p1  ORF type:complete len:225 (-),score=68.46 gnl/Spiro4/27917_TR13823_c0_g1_i1:48-722(-)
MFTSIARFCDDPFKVRDMEAELLNPSERKGTQQRSGNNDKQESGWDGRKAVINAYASVRREYRGTTPAEDDERKQRMQEMILLNEKQKMEKKERLRLEFEAKLQEERLKEETRRAAERKLGFRVRNFLSGLRVQLMKFPGANHPLLGNRRVLLFATAATALIIPRFLQLRNRARDKAAAASAAASAATDPTLSTVEGSSSSSFSSPSSPTPPPSDSPFSFTTTK